jgi:hypothetical protein
VREKEAEEVQFISPIFEKTITTTHERGRKFGVGGCLTSMSIRITVIYADDDDGG